MRLARELNFLDGPVVSARFGLDFIVHMASVMCLELFFEAGVWGHTFFVRSLSTDYSLGTIED